jgi:hypothetical protein
VNPSGVGTVVVERTDVVIVEVSETVAVDVT